MIQLNHYRHQSQARAIHIARACDWWR